METISLPLELQQQIFSFLDARSFAAARSVCKWWNYSATESVTLAHQLRKLPIAPQVKAADSTPPELLRVFREASQKMVLNARCYQKEIEENTDDGSELTSGLLTRTLRMGLASDGARTVATPCGTRTVVLRERTITLYDTSGCQPVVLAQRTINDLEEALGSGPWLRVNYDHFELALSASGNLLAIAQDRTIQIYNLLAEPDSFTINHCVGNNAGPCIGSVEFEQNDRVLRVGLRSKGRVVYLGSPAPLPSDGDCVNEPVVSATVDHWRGRHGLRYTFLDSASLRDQDAAQVSGVQLLRPWSNGFLFAAQKFGAGEPRCYVFGHIRVVHAVSSYMNIAGPLSVDSQGVTVFTRLETSASISRNMSHSQSQSFNRHAALSTPALISAPAGDAIPFRYFDNMPSAIEHHPRFALSSSVDKKGSGDTHPDDVYLALVESDKKQPMQRLPVSHAFLYRLPRMNLWPDMLERKPVSDAEDERDVAAVPATQVSRDRRLPPRPRERLSASTASSDDDDDDESELLLPFSWRSACCSCTPPSRSCMHCDDHPNKRRRFTSPQPVASPYFVPRLPLYVGALAGRVAALEFEGLREDDTSAPLAVLHATTAEARVAWELCSDLVC